MLVSSRTVYQCVSCEIMHLRRCPRLTSDIHSKIRGVLKQHAIALENNYVCRMSLTVKHSSLAVCTQADRACRELQRYKGTASRGGFMRALKALWSLLLTVGWVGFIGFVYVLVSEDALRPRGIDVYRFAT